MKLKILCGRTIFIICLFVLVSGFFNVYASNLKIGIVNTEKVLRESAPAVKAQKRIEEEFLPRDKQIKEMADQVKTLQDKLEEKDETITESGRRNLERDLAKISRDYQRAQRQVREDLSLRQNEEYGVILERAKKAVQQIAETEKYDLILQLQDAVYRSKRIDITEQVIKVLDVK